MTVLYDSVFNAPYIVRYNRQNADGTSEIACSQRFTLNPEQPTVDQYPIIIVSSMADVRQVKDVPKRWVIDQHVGNLESVA